MSRSTFKLSVAVLALLLLPSMAKAQCGKCKGYDGNTHYDCVAGSGGTRCDGAPFHTYCSPCEGVGLAPLEIAPDGSLRQFAAEDFADNMVPDGVHLSDTGIGATVARNGCGNVVHRWYSPETEAAIKKATSVIEL